MVGYGPWVGRAWFRAFARRGGPWSCRTQLEPVEVDPQPQSSVRYPSNHRWCRSWALRGRERCSPAYERRCNPSGALRSLYRNRSRPPSRMTMQIPLRETTSDVSVFQYLRTMPTSRCPVRSGGRVIDSRAKVRITLNTRAAKGAKRVRRPPARRTTKSLSEWSPVTQPPPGTSEITSAGDPDHLSQPEPGSNGGSLYWWCPIVGAAPLVPTPSHPRAAFRQLNVPRSSRHNISRRRGAAGRHICRS
jgi:hypothetical protein